MHEKIESLYTLSVGCVCALNMKPKLQHNEVTFPQLLSLKMYKISSYRFESSTSGRTP